MSFGRFFSAIAHQGFIGLEPEESSASSVWTPLSLGAALVAWYKADAGITLNGSNVSGWADQSGNSNNLSQVNAANQPAYSTGVLNTLPGVVFGNAAADTALFSPAITSFANTASMFMVSQLVGGGNGRFAVLQSTNQGNDFSSTLSAIFLYEPSSTSISAYRNGAKSNTSVNNSFNQLGSIYDSVNNTVYVGGTSATPVSSSGSFDSSMFIGLGDYASVFNTQSPGGSNLEGTICEVIVTNSAVSSADRTNINTYLKNRWGV